MEKEMEDEEQKQMQEIYDALPDELKAKIDNGEDLDDIINSINTGQGQSLE